MKTILLLVTLVAVAPSARTAVTEADVTKSAVKAALLMPQFEETNRDKTGTTWCQDNEADAQTQFNSALTTLHFSAAEGTGLEPATGFPAPHFQC